MRRFVALVVLGVAPLVAMGGLRAAGDPPAWAYAIPLPRPRRRTCGSARHVDQAASGQHAHLHATADLRRLRAGRLVSRRPPDDARHRRAREAPGCARVCPLPLPEWQGPSGKRRRLGVAGLVLHPADERLPRRPPQERGAAEDQHQRHDRDREGHDAGRDQGRPPNTSAR